MKLKCLGLQNDISWLLEMDVLSIQRMDFDLVRSPFYHDRNWGITEAETPLACGYHRRFSSCSSGSWSRPWMASSGSSSEVLQALPCVSRSTEQPKPLAVPIPKGLEYVFEPLYGRGLNACFLQEVGIIGFYPCRQHSFYCLLKLLSCLLIVN